MTTRRLGRAVLLAVFAILFAAPDSGAAPANDDFANAAVLAMDAGTHTVSASGATAEAGETLPSGFVSVWYQYTPHPTSVAFSAVFGDVTPVVEVFTGDDLSSLVAVPRSDGFDDETVRGFPIAHQYAVDTDGSRVWIRASFAPAAGSVTLAWGEGGLSGRVVDGSGAAVAGAIVSLRRVDTSFPIAERRTGPDGTYTFEAMPQALFKVRFRASGLPETWFDGRQSFSTASHVASDGFWDTEGISVVMHTSAVITGSVDTPLRGVLEGVEVQVRPATGGAALTATTDAGGVYLVTGVPPGDHHVRFQRAGYVTEWFSDALQEADADPVTVTAGRYETVDATLQPVALVGQIFGSDLGTPQDVCVTAYNVDGSSGVGAEVDEAGVYRIDDIQPGVYKVYATPCDYGYFHDYLPAYFPFMRTWEEAVEVTVLPYSDTVGIDIVMPLGGKIRGRITAASGTVVPAGSPLPEIYVGTYSDCYSVPTDADGRYEIRGLDSGRYNVRVGYCSDQRFVPFTIRDIDVRQGEVTAGVDAAMSAYGQVRGTVTDAQGVPIYGICVTTEHANMGSRTDADGHYTLFASAAGPGAVGFYECGGTSYGWITEWYDDVTSKDDATPITFADDTVVSGIDASLALGGSVAGRTVDVRGRGVAGVCVDLYDANRTSVRRGHSEGSYEVGPVPGGVYRVGFTDCIHHRYNDAWLGGSSFETATPVTVVPDEETSVPDVVLSLDGAIAGTVRDSSAQPVAQICVELYDAGNNLRRTATSEDDGTYEVGGGLATGEYRLHLRDCGSGRYLESWHGGTSLETATPVPVTSGQTTGGVDLSAVLGGRITGHVTGRGGRPFPGACANLYTADDATTVRQIAATDQYGSYTVHGLTPGSYKLHVDNCPGLVARITPAWHGAASDHASATPIASAAEATATADVVVDAQLQYIAIGDQIAAGTGLPDATGDCVRSPSSYPSLFEADLRADFTLTFADLTCDGAAAATGLAGQVSEAMSLRDGKPLLATISSGWEDLDLKDAIDQRQILCDDSEAAFQDHMEDRVARIRSAVDQAARTLMSVGDAVVLVGEMVQPMNEQPAFLDDPRVVGGAASSRCDPDGLPPHRARTRLEALVSRVNDELIDIASALPLHMQGRYRVVSLERPFEGHEAKAHPSGMCGNEGLTRLTWIQEPIAGSVAGRADGECLYPNEAGHRAMADAFGLRIPHGADAGDIDPPVLTFRTTDGAILQHSQAAQVTGRVTDQLRGVASVELTYLFAGGVLPDPGIEGLPLSPDTKVLTPGCDSRYRRCTFARNLPTVPGPYVVRAVAVDLAGNRSAPVEIRVVVI